METFPKSTLWTRQRSKLKCTCSFHQTRLSCFWGSERASMRSHLMTLRNCQNLAWNRLRLLGNLSALPFENEKSHSWQVEPRKNRCMRTHTSAWMYAFAPLSSQWLPQAQLTEHVLARSFPKLLYLLGEDSHLRSRLLPNECHRQAHIWQDGLCKLALPLCSEVLQLLYSTWRWDCDRL